VVCGGRLGPRKRTRACAKRVGVSQADGRHCYCGPAWSREGHPAAGSGARWQAGAWGVGRLAARRPIVSQVRGGGAVLICRRRCSPGVASQQGPSGLGEQKKLTRKWAAGGGCRLRKEEKEQQNDRRPIEFSIFQPIQYHINKSILYFSWLISFLKNNQISNTKRILTWLLTTGIKPKPGEGTNETKQKLKHLFVDSL